MKILIAVDGSPSSVVARDLVASLRWPAGSEAHLVGAYSVPIDWTGGAGSGMDWVGDIDDSLRDDVDDRLAALTPPLVASGLTVHRHPARGRAADAILATAAAEGVDLIVTGSRGRGRLATMLLGSVATEVAMHAPCPGPRGPRTECQPSPRRDRRIPGGDQHPRPARRMAGLYRPRCRRAGGGRA